GIGEKLLNLDLMAVRNWDEIVAMVGAAASDARQDAWIVGRGWHQEKWDGMPERTVDGVPVHESLSAVSPDNPVYLTHASGHASFVNARAMELAGITRNTPDPPGGTIVRDGSGEPTGALRATAQRLVNEALARYEAQRSPEELRAECRRQVQLAGEEPLRKGVTGFHGAGTSCEAVDPLRERAEQGELPVRLCGMIRYASNDELA